MADHTCTYCDDEALCGVPLSRTEKPGNEPIKLCPAHALIIRQELSIAVRVWTEQGENAF